MIDLGVIKDNVKHKIKYNFLLKNNFRHLKSLESLDELMLREMEENCAAEIVRLAANRSDFYNKLYKGINLNDEFGKYFPSLPVITRQDVMENTDKIPTIPKKLLNLSHTSGTSGTPLAVYRSVQSTIKENAYVWYYRMSRGLKPGQPCVSLRGALKANTISHYNKAENILYLSSYKLSKSTIPQYMALLSAFKPAALLAYPSTAYTLVTLMREAGYEINIPLIFTSSETVYDFQRFEIENTLGGTIFDWYGNVERTIALGQCEFGNYHGLPMYSLNEFRETGVVTTSLINKAFPLIRYYVDDIFTMLDGKCACGRSEGVKSIEGRYDDVVILDDGTRITALSLAFYNIKHLVYSQIIQKVPGKIELNIVTNDGFSRNDEAQLLSQIRSRTNNNLQIKVNHVDQQEIIKSRSGKFQLVVSSCAQKSFSSLQNHKN